MDLTVEKDMIPPIWMYYQLDGFHQNHRRYVKSRDDKQLKASMPVQTSASRLAACSPAVTGDSGRPYYPCGLVARSIFNDSFALIAQDPGEDSWKRVAIDSKAWTIAWHADADGVFANYDPEQEHPEHGGKKNQELLDMWLTQRFPRVTCEQIEISDTKPYKPLYAATRKDAEGRIITDCEGYTGDSPKCRFVDAKNQPVECNEEYQPVVQEDWGLKSGHFIVWMRVAGLPTFRKLWGKVDTELKAGTKLRVYVANHFPVTGFGGRKSIVLSTSSPIGGRNDFLGIGYIVVGGCCFVFGAWFLWKHLSSSG